MKKKGKSLLTYLLILIGIAFIVFAICIAVLVLSPGKEIAGFVYSKYSQSDTIYAYMSNSDQQIYSETYYSHHLGTDKRMLGADDVQHLIINAGAHDVTIRHMQQGQVIEGFQFVNAIDKFSFAISSQYSGIYKQEKYPNGVEYSIVYDQDTKTLTLNFDTPSGLNFNRSGDIVVELPEAFYHLSQSVKTGTNITANTTATLKVVSDKGSVSLGGNSLLGREVRTSSLANVDITTDSGSITLNENFYACGDTLTLKSNKGEINCSNSINQSEMTINLSSERGEVNFKDITAKELNVYSKKADVNVKNVDLGAPENAINWTGDRGRLFADTINGSLLGHEDASATNFSIKHITGQFYLPKGDTCDVDIEKIDGKVKIVSKNNNISIKNASSNVIIQTQKGSVYLENCTNTLDVSSTKAPVTLKNCSGEIRVKTTKGKISGTITNLVGQNNNLNSEKSSIDIQFEQNMAFNMDASSSKKKVYIDYASMSESNSSYKDVKFNGGSDSTKIVISAKKEVNISNIKGE